MITAERFALFWESTSSQRQILADLLSTLTDIEGGLLFQFQINGINIFAFMH